MLKKRIIVCLDVKNNMVVKGVRFEHLNELGNPVMMAEKYVMEGADELVFLDITASQENRSVRFSWVKEVAGVLNIPFTVGGGVASLKDAEELMQSGADKISVNTAALRRPYLIKELSDTFGAQSVVVAVDVRKENDGSMYVYSHGGKQRTTYLMDEWLKTAQDAGAGEFLITAIHTDGTGMGFDLELYQKTDTLVAVPVIASGGAGTTGHFMELFQKTNVSGALAAGIFHRNEISIKQIKNVLLQHNIPVRI